MSPRARPFASALIGSVLALAALAISSDTQAATANAFPMEFAPLGFKVAITVPEEGQLCIVIPQDAQDPVACLGLDPGAMAAALPPGPDRPFGLAFARMVGWSYFVMLTPSDPSIEAKEDIEQFLADAVKPDPDLPDVKPKLVGPSPDRKYEILTVKGVPVVKFRIDADVPPENPGYDVSTKLHYAAFGGKPAMISFITSPRDVDKVMPYADATIQSLVLPPRAIPERFGKPRAEIEKSGSRTAITILGPLVALGALLFLWLARSKKPDDETPPEKDPSRSARKSRKRAEEEEEARDEGEEEAGDDEEAAREEDAGDEGAEPGDEGPEDDKDRGK